MFEAVLVYTNVQELTGESLLDGFSMNSEPIETCVFRMAPVGENPAVPLFGKLLQVFSEIEGGRVQLIHS